VVEGSLQKVVSFLNRLAEDRRYAEALVDSSFRAITPDAIRMWVREDVKLLPEEVRKLYFENPCIAPHTKRALAENWDIVEEYLGQPENTLRKMLSANPQNAEALSDPKIREYVVGEINSTYRYLKEFVWGFRST